MDGDTNGQHKNDQTNRKINQNPILNRWGFLFNVIFISMKKIVKLTESDLTRIVKRVIMERNKLNDIPNIGGQIRKLKKGDEIIIHKPSQKGEGINTPVTFLKYNRLWDWAIVEKDGEKLKVSISQDPTEDVIFIEKI